uniref:S-protein homolog n=1 Tax=Solanum tuberosum TaxID=4113 RepID=M1DD62_SOLTU
MPYNIQGYCEEKQEVHIHNDLPQNTPQLEVHCASGDDDLGHRYPGIGTEFNWSFCPTFSTLYFCHFWWNGKDLRFDVFNNSDACVRNRGHGFIPYDTSDCHWQVKDDGFYIGYFNQNVGQVIYTKYLDW